MFAWYFLKSVLMRKEKDLLSYLTIPRLVFPVLISSALFSHISSISRERVSLN